MEYSSFTPLVFFKTHPHTNSNLPQFLHAARPRNKFPISFEPISESAEITNNTNESSQQHSNIQTKWLYCREFSMYSLYILKCCILDIFWLQLVFFIFKLLFMITYLVSFVFMII